MVGTGFGSVKEIIRRDVNKPCSDFFTSQGQIGNSKMVDFIGQHNLLLRLVNRSIGSTIDDKGRGLLFKKMGDICRITDIQFFNIRKYKREFRITGG